ncbi:DNA mismatch repair protein MutS [Kyrpidia spormannii]|uniref:DNA mismatch repair protein MutS n=1 Tax=Kyrpidia spormannii TaxID=2055160 RepID=A0A2K8N911_9BACL|nr:DNA mismatch repair protein MutS [Kyrpidia spormannii]ATY84922.1 DNA mismatch repair protein MutS [Kyrpidia spormannii]
MSYTPMMQQYLDVKGRCPDALLMFRLGDFYELFFEDAEIAARELEITLTGREAGGGRRVPMCGVPYHAVEGYIAALVERGYKVAICDQMEDPALAKGLVRREITRIVTPGTLLEDRGKEEKEQRLIGAVIPIPEGWSVAFADLSTGDRWAGAAHSIEQVMDDGLRYRPAEWLIPEEAAGEPWVTQLSKSTEAILTHRGHGKKTFTRMENGGWDDLPEAGGEEALSAIASYIEETQRRQLVHWKPVQPLHDATYMAVDAFARRNLELVQTVREGRRTGSLLWLLDETVTAMGGRLLRQWLERPLIDPGAIARRQDGIEELVGQWMRRNQLREDLRCVYDLERLLGRVSYGSAGPRDLRAVAQSLSQAPKLAAVLAGARSSILADIERRLDPCEEVRDLLDRALADDPPATAKEPGVIRDGFSSELDELRRASREGRSWIAALEQRERERTGIKSLKIGYNRVFGYYIEVTKANLALVPREYERRQTLAASERYVTPELKEMESRILDAQERAETIEYQLFVELRGTVVKALPRLQRLAGAMAELDVLCGLAEVAAKRRYTRPVVDDSSVIEIRGGRHPVVEAVLPDGTFVPNDTFLDGDNRRVALITGPNMAGKSTYMRQVALIVLLAQVGSFVPADSARIGIVDRLFTRIGAADDLVAGKSTFMVEMVELATILRNATPRSLIILDEIGRGTSTYDGMSIARAAVEYIHDPTRVGARTLFATHYHELTGLADELPGVHNFSTEVREDSGGIVFLHRLVDRPADRSYGIHVARLAGLPEDLLERAEAILTSMEQVQQGLSQTAAACVGGEGGEADRDLTKVPQETGGRSTADEAGRGLDKALLHPVLERLRKARVLDMTPIQALQELYELHLLVREENEP